MENKVEVNVEIKMKKLLQRIAQLEDENSSNYALAVEYKAKYDELLKKQAKKGLKE